MATFLMFGKYSATAIKAISTTRTKKAEAIIAKLGGKVLSMYALMGEQDLMLVVELPGIEDAMKASVALARASGISFTTCPAVTVETFDKIVTKR
ncbi:MAG: GYD domain-containing protein [Spirochaetia bacterium]|jgi:uncharacterized protein with GYD domain